MIPYEELSAALERWRVRNGLPGTPPLFAEGSAMKRTATAPAASYSTGSGSGSSAGAASYAAPAVSYSAPASAYSPPGPPTAPPRPPAPAMPPPPSPETLDEEVGEFAEDDVLGEAELDNDGPDFTHAFSGRPPGAPAARSAITAPLSADEEREATLIGATNPSIVPPPAAAWPESSPADTGRQSATVTVIDDDDEFDEKTPA